MRTLSAAVSCLLVALWAAWGICDEPTKQPDISFAIPRSCPRQKPRWPFKDVCASLCLAGSYKAGLDVVLVCRTGIQSTKTSAPCNDNHSGKLIRSTQLEDIEKDVKPLSWRGNIALVGVDPTAVRLVPGTLDPSPLPEEMEREARQLLRATYDPRGPNTYFGSAYADNPSPIRVFRAGKATLLRFTHSEMLDSSYAQIGGQHGMNGPLVLFIDHKAYRLPGACTSDPLFVRVNDKLYLSYDASECCTCSLLILHVLVYDLSGTSPKEVFEHPRPEPGH
jgi:hypothetical protein